MEAFAVSVYLIIDALFTEVAVMEQVSQAERWVNEYCGQSFTGTIPDGVKFATLYMARYFMHVQMVEAGHLKELPMKLKDIIEIIEIPLNRHKVSPDYSASASLFDLNTLRG